MTEEKEDKTYDLEERLINICHQYQNRQKEQEKIAIIGYQDRINRMAIYI